MTRWTWLVVLAVGGCAGSQADDGWVATSQTLQSQGVYALQVAGGGVADAQTVLLRGASQEALGELRVVQSGQAHTVTLQLGGHLFSQAFGAEKQQMLIALDGREGTFRFDGGAWQGDADAHALLERAQSYVELVGSIGIEAQLGSAAPISTPASPASGSLPLCCSNVVVAGHGAAFWWEVDAQDVACRRATSLVRGYCKAGTAELGGLDCCGGPPEGECLSCYNLGAWVTCFTDGYLQKICN